MSKNYENLTFPAACELFAARPHNCYDVITDLEFLFPQQRNLFYTVDGVQFHVASYLGPKLL